jgi:hypothetical protein
MDGAFSLDPVRGGGEVLRGGSVAADGGALLMPHALVYVDTSEVRPGALARLREAIRDLARVVEASVPRIVSYNAYFDASGQRMTVVHVHPDSASLEQHLQAVAPHLAPFKDLLRLRSIVVYGEVGPSVRARLEEKTRLLGGTIEIHAVHAGFLRPTDPQKSTSTPSNTNLAPRPRA